jgi:hypothetical protein
MWKKARMAARFICAICYRLQKRFSKSESVAVGGFCIKEGKVKYEIFSVSKRKVLDVELHEPPTKQM